MESEWNENVLEVKSLIRRNYGNPIPYLDFRLAQMQKKIELFNEQQPRIYCHRNLLNIDIANAIFIIILTTKHHNPFRSRNCSKFREMNDCVDDMT